MYYIFTLDFSFFSLYKVGETTSDGLFSLDCLRCVGACGLAPVVTIAGKVYGRLTPEKVRDILSEYYLLEQV